MNFETLFLKQNQKQEKEELPLFTEYAIDFDTLEDNTVTIRDRDTTDQVRVKIDEL